jgi:ribose transport system substrate-binding protein
MSFVLVACGTISSASPSATTASTPAATPAGSPGASAPAASGGGGTPTARHIGIISLAANNGGSARMVAAMKSVGSQKGWTVDVVDTAGDATKVGPAIQSFVSAGVDGIAVDILDPSAIANEIAAAKQAAIPVISLNSDDYNPDVASQIVANPFDVGMQEATYIADRMGRQGKVAMLAFSAATNIRLRQEVLENALKAYPGIQIVEKHELDVAKAVDDAQATAQAWLTKYPSGQLNAIWAAWDEPALGAAAAADGQGRSDLFVTGTDYSPAIAEKMRAGSVLQADWFIDYATIGTTAMQLFADSFDGKPLPPHVYVQLQLVTPNNLPSGDFPPSSSTYTLYSGK